MSLFAILTIFGALLASTPLPAADSEGLDSLVILSFNVREWSRDTDKEKETFWKNRMEAMKKMIEEVSPDVICFQELMPPATRYVPDGYKSVGLSVSHPVYIRKNLRASRHRFSIFWESCLVEGVSITNIHSRWEREIVERVVRHVNSHLTGKDVACGDWNTFLATLNDAGLKMDSARVLLDVPETDTFANFSRPEQSHGAIDHFFVNGVTPLSYRMITNGYGVAKISDHYPIVLTIKL